MLSVARDDEPGPPTSEEAWGELRRIVAEAAIWQDKAEGLLVDINLFKRELRAVCARLDSRTLIPGESSRLSWSRHGEAVDVLCGERSYRFPAADALVLPLPNTSIELLARMLWHDLAPHLAGSSVAALAVSVEESAGQQCWYEADLPG